MEERIAEFIGIMLGDGNLGVYNSAKYNKKQYRVRISLDSRNKNYLEYIKILFQEVLRITPRIHFKSKENAVDIGTYKKEKFLFVRDELGLVESPKINKMKIPENYFKREFFAFILRGLFDTDGCLSVFKNNGRLYPRIEIKICPSPAQKQFVEILKELKFSYRLQNLDKDWIRIRISGKDELKRWFDVVGSANKIHLDKAKILLNSEGGI